MGSDLERKINHLEQKLDLDNILQQKTSKAIFSDMDSTLDNSKDLVELGGLYIELHEKTNCLDHLLLSEHYLSIQSELFNANDFCINHMVELYQKILQYNVEDVSKSILILNKGNFTFFGRFARFLISHGLQKDVAKLPSLALSYLNKGFNPLNLQKNIIGQMKYFIESSIVDCLIITRDWEKALDISNKQISNFPEKMMAYGQKAVILRQSNRFNEALDTHNLCEKRCRNDPLYESGSYLIHVERADILRRTGRVKEAVKYFELALEKRPYSFYTSALLADCYNLFGQENKAFNIIEKIIDKAHLHPYIYGIKADILLNMGSHEEAIINYLSGMNLDPGDPQNYKGLQKCFVKLGGASNVVSVMKDYFTQNKSKEAGTFVLSLLDYMGDNGAEDEVWQQLVDILKNDPDFEKKLISREKTKNPIKYDMSSPLSGLTYILDTCNPKKNPKQEKERLEKRYKTHKFFYDKFKKMKCQDQIAKPIAVFEKESSERGLLGIKKKKKDSYYLMKHAQGVRLHELIQNQEATYDNIESAMSNLVIFHGVSSGAEAEGKLNLEDPIDSNPTYYTERFRDIFLKNLSKFGKSVGKETEKELLFAYGTTINSALHDSNKSIYKDANPKNYLVRDNGGVVALDIESNLKVPRHLDVVSLLEFGSDYLTSQQKDTLIEYHRNALSKISGEDVSVEENKADYHIAAVQRHFELAGYRIEELSTNSNPNECEWARDAAIYHIGKGVEYLDSCIRNEYFEDSEPLKKIGATIRHMLK